MLYKESSKYIQDLIFKFYNDALECLNLYENSFDGAPVFNWTNFSSLLELNDTKKV